MYFQGMGHIQTTSLLCLKRVLSNLATRPSLEDTVKKWVDAKYLLGCAFYVDLLTPCSIFSKVMQSDDLDVLAAFVSLLKTVKEVSNFSSLPLDKWPMYAATLKKIGMQDGERVYQCQALRNYEQAEHHYTMHNRNLCVSITSCLKSRLG